MSEKKRMFRISPELNDGDCSGICETKEQLLEAIGNWADGALSDDFNVGEGCSVEIIELTDEELEAIPSA